MMVLPTVYRHVAGRFSSLAGRRVATCGSDRFSIGPPDRLGRSEGDLHGVRCPKVAPAAASTRDENAPSMRVL